MASKAAPVPEEPKQTLPVGHPKAGYVSPDLSTHEGTGTIPDKEIEWHEARNDAREEEVAAVEEGEDKAAKEEAELKAKDAEVLQAWKEETGQVPPAPPALPSEEAGAAATSTTSKSTSASSSS